MTFYYIFKLMGGIFMSKKRILSLLLASSLVVTAFVGCGSKSEGSGGIKQFK